MTKFIAEFNSQNREKLSSLISFLNQLFFRRIFIVIAIFSIAVTFYHQQIRVSLWLMAALIACAIFKAKYIYQVSIFKGLQRFDVLAKTSVIANPVNLISVAICAYFFPSVHNFLIVYCIACFAFYISIIQFRKQIPVLPIQHEKSDINEHKKRILKQVYSATLIILLGALVFRQSQILVLEHNNFLSEAGFFNIAFILATAAITLIPGIYQEVLLPKITKAMGDGTVKTQIDQAQRYLLILSVAVTIPVILYADVIINLLYGDKYLGAVFPLQVMMALRALIVLNDGANLTLISADKQPQMAKISVILFIVAIILSALITPRFGINGALLVYGTLVCLLITRYFVLANKTGFTYLPFKVWLSIGLSTIIALLPTLVINHYLTGLYSMIIGSLFFLILYMNLLFKFKGYDDSAKYLLKSTQKKAPKIIRSYLSWCIKSFQ